MKYINEDNNDVDDDLTICILLLNFCFIILVWGLLVIQLKYCPVLPSLNKVDYYCYDDVDDDDDDDNDDRDDGDD